MKLTDKEIKNNIIDKLQWDGRIDASHLQIDVYEGQVTLYGKVPNYTAKRAVMDHTWSTTDVAAVNDQIMVKYHPTSLPILKDETLAANVDTVLALDSSIDPMDIDVIVENGKVVLEGSVDAYWKKVKAETLVSDMVGVTEVIDKLVVIPDGNYLDKDIAQDLIRIYDKNSYVDTEHLDVQVEDGVITLSGMVPSWAEKRTAFNLANFAYGVRDVIDRITVG